jgi:Flp pilus assembly protein TadD
MRCKFIPLVFLLLSLACPKSENTERPSAEAEGDGLYLQAQAAFSRNDFPEAVKQFEAVKKVNPSDKRLPAALGEAYLGQLKFPEAIAAFETATQIDAKRATNWSRLSYLYVLRNDFDNASAAIEKTLALSPNDVNALEARAEMLLKQDKLDEAVKAFALAGLKATGAARSEFVLRATEELNRAKKPELTLPLLDAAVDAGISSAALFTEYGDRLVEAKRLPEASAAYTSAAKLDTKDATLWELVGEIEMQLGHDEKAESAYRDSLKVKDRAIVHLALAKLATRQKNAAAAQAEFQKALDTSTGEEIRETLELADYLKSLGRKKESLMLLKNLAEEPEQKENLELQMQTARLAQELKDSTVLKETCARVMASKNRPPKCP